MPSLFRVRSADNKEFNVDVTAGVLTVQINKVTVFRAQQAAITSLTHAFGTADSTVADVTAVHDQTILNNNFKDITTKQEQILAALRAHGIIAT